MAAGVLTSRKRLLVVLIVLAALLVLLVFRVGYWNIVRGEFLQSEAESQWISDSPVMARRGSILDRNMNVLAQSAVSDTVVVLPNDIKPEKDNEVTDRLAEILQMPREEVYQKVSAKTRMVDGEEKKIGEVWLKRQITNEQSEQIKALIQSEVNPLKGVKLITDVKRYYPNKDFASQIIGYTTLDGVGQTGIERRYNSVLEGRQGRMVAETDKLKNDIPNGQEMFIPPVDGENVVLTLDDVLQSFLEVSCKRAYQDLAPESVQGVIMDVTNGEVLAIVNVPDFDLNAPPRGDGDALSLLSANIVTAAMYEPGNIFSVFTAAAAKDAGVLKETYHCEGALSVDGGEIVCGEAHGVQTYTEAVQNGCNVAAAMMASDMGEQAYFDYLGRFGFGRPTGIDFSTDTAGDLMAIKYASAADVAMIGEGQNLKISQMQLMNAAASLVNGGMLYTPRLVVGLTDASGEYVEIYEPEVKGQSVSAETSAEIRGVLRENVSYGKADVARMADYSSGAIYGATQKYDSNGAVVQDRVVSTFLSFSTADAPKYAVMITLNGIGDGEGADVAAAPYVKETIEEILKYTYVQPDQSGDEPEQGKLTEETIVTVPDVVEMALQTAADTLGGQGLSYQADGTGTVVAQTPAAGEQAEAGTEVSLEMDYKTPQESAAPDGAVDMAQMPDFTGMGFEEARDLAISSGLRFYAKGSGVAKTQYPLYGAKVAKGSAVQVTFRVELE